METSTKISPVFARILDLHPILWEKLFPHVPSTLKIREAVLALKPEERDVLLAETRQTMNYCKAFEEALIKINQGK